MKIVIDISKEEYQTYINHTEAILDKSIPLVHQDLLKAVINGTPLPEHHGRLIDADELYGDFIDGTEGYDCQTWNRIEIGDIIDNALTIIGGSDSE